VIEASAVSRARLVFVALATVLLAGTIGGELARALTPPPNRFELAAAAMSEHGIGFGPDVLLPNRESDDQPMAVALYASAEALHFLRTRTGASRDQAIAGANRLLGLAVDDEHYGWGLGFPWQSEDGSTSPADTIYGITTALGVRALLDVYAVDRQDRFLQSATHALDSYRTQFTAVDASTGYFQSSGRATDEHPVISVSALLAGQYARAAELTQNDAYATVARSAAAWVMAQQERSGQDILWLYRAGGTDPSDGVNAAYIVDGLLQVEHFLGGTKLDRDAALRWLARFAVSTTLSSRYVGGTAPDRSWGVGYLLFDFCIYAPDAAATARLRSALDQYEYAPGRYGPLPGVDVLYPRFQGHVLLALAVCPADPA